MPDVKKPGLVASLLGRTLRGATIGAASLLLQGAAPAGDALVQPLLERARARADEDEDVAAGIAPLVLQRGGAVERIAGHRSHSSHRSHNSHSSHHSGSGYVPPAPYVPTPQQPPPPPAPKPVANTTIVIKATPRARVFIGGKEVGTTPTSPIEVKAGELEVTLENKTAGRVTKRVTVETGRANEVTIAW